MLVTERIRQSMKGLLMSLSSLLKYNLATSLLSTALLLGSAQTTLQAEDTPFSDKQKTEIEALIAKTLAEQPELVINAIKIYQAQIAEKQAAAETAQLSKYQDYFADDTFAPVSGNPKGDVTIVEFLDYNCGYCKRTVDAVKKTVADDKNIRLVYMDMPILGPGSVTAATAALASVKQGKYDEFHYALMKFKGRLAEKSIFKVAEEVGLNIDDLKKEMQAPAIRDAIQRNISIARSLNITGTPAFLINDTKIPGAISEAQLAQAVSEARQKSK